MEKIPVRVTMLALMTFAVALVTISCQATEDEQPTATQDRNALTVAAGGGTLTHESGASIDLPPGALPQDEEVRMTVVDSPTLPEGVEVVGDAYEIIADADLTVPATISLPIVGDHDRSDLLIYRVQDDGTTMSLASSAEGDRIVATTPGFSKFQIGTGKLLIGTPVLAGKPIVAASESAVYSATVKGIGLNGPAIESYTWFLCGREVAARIREGEACGPGLTLPAPGGRSVTVDAGDQTGNVSLSIVVNMGTGVSHWTGIIIKIKAAMSVEVVGPVFPNRYSTAQYQARLHYGPGGPVDWSWDFGDGTTGALIQEQKTLDLPPHEYTEPGTYTLTVSVVDEQGKSAGTALVVEVENNPSAELFCDFTRVPLERWLASDQGVLPTVSDLPSCWVRVQEGTPEYEWSITFKNTATMKTSTFIQSTASEGFTHDMALPPQPPGTYNVTLKVTDSDGKSGQYTTHSIQWYWNNPEQLKVNFIDPDEAIKVVLGDTVSFTAHLEAPEMAGTGDDLITELLSERYVFEWDFRDGTTFSDRVDVSTGDSSFTHAFEEEGAHYVQVNVTDELYGMTGSDQLLVEVVTELEMEPTPIPAPAITASLLMQAIEDAAAAENAVPTGNPPELVDNKRLRPGTFDYQPGLTHSVEADLQLEADLDNKVNPVRATFKIEVYETEEEALAGGRVTESPVSDNYPTFEEYVDGDRSQFNGYTASVTMGEGMRQYLTWTEPFSSGGISGFSIPSKSTAIHTRVVNLDGVWFLLNVRAWSSVTGDQELWDNYTQRSNDLADVLLDALQANLQPPG